MENQDQQPKSEKILDVTLHTFIAPSVPANDQTRYDVADFSIFKVGGDQQSEEVPATAKALDISNPDDFVIGKPSSQNYVDLDIDLVNTPATNEIVATETKANSLNDGNLKTELHNQPAQQSEQKFPIANESSENSTRFMDTTISCMGKLLSDLPEESEEENESTQKKNDSDWYSKDFKEEIVTSASVAFASQAEEVVLPSSDVSIRGEAQSTLSADISESQSSTGLKEMTFDASIVSKSVIINAAAGQPAQQLFASNSENGFAGTGNFEQDNKLVSDSPTEGNLPSPPSFDAEVVVTTVLDEQQQLGQKQLVEADKPNEWSGTVASESVSPSISSVSESASVSAVLLSSPPPPTNDVSTTASVTECEVLPPSLHNNSQKQQSERKRSSTELGNSSTTNLQLHTSASSKHQVLSQSVSLSLLQSEEEKETEAEEAKVKEETVSAAKVSTTAAPEEVLLSSANLAVHTQVHSLPPTSTEAVTVPAKTRLQAGSLTSSPDTDSAPLSTATNSTTTTTGTTSTTIMGRKNQSYRRENSSDEAVYSGPGKLPFYHVTFPTCCC